MGRQKGPGKVGKGLREQRANASSDLLKYLRDSRDQCMSYILMGKAPCRSCVLEGGKHHMSQLHSVHLIMVVEPNLFMHYTLRSKWFAEP